MKNFVGPLDIIKVEFQLRQLTALIQNIALSSNSYFSELCTWEQTFLNCPLA